MIRLTPSEEARNEHTEAVIKRIQQSYDEKEILADIKNWGQRVSKISWKQMSVRCECGQSNAVIS